MSWSDALVLIVGMICGTIILGLVICAWAFKSNNKDTNK